jgi:hypothetical protein
MLKNYFIFVLIIILVCLLNLKKNKTKNKEFFNNKIKLFNIDLHISVIEDFKNVISNFNNVEVIDNSISSHAHIMNKKMCRKYYINSDNWKDCLNNEDKLNLFYKKHKNELEKYQGFVVTHTPSFILLYEKLNKPIIVINSCRYENPFINDIKKWKKLNVKLKNLEKKKLLYVVSNNKADRDYLQMGTNIKSEYIPSLCLYINDKYLGIKNKFIISDRFNIIPENDLLIKKDRALGRNYKNKNLMEYKGIIYIPYEISTMSIFEQYSCNIPLFFPSKKFLYQLINSNKIKLQSKYSRIYPDELEKALNKNKKNFNFWVERADFYDSENMKYITYFDSIEHLNNLIRTVNCKDISFKMSKHNEIRKKKNFKKMEQYFTTSIF